MFTIKNKKVTNKSKTKRLPSKNRRLKTGMIAMVVIFAGIGIYTLIQTFAATPDPYADVLAEVYSEKTDKTTSDGGTFVGRLYTSGVLVCNANPNKSDAEVQKHKVVALTRREKAAITKLAADKELQTTNLNPDTLAADVNNNRTTTDSARLTTYGDKGIANTQAVDATQPASKRKNKAIDLHKLIKRDCQKTGTEFTPQNVTLSVQKLPDTTTGAVAWPATFPVLRGEAQIVSGNIAKVKAATNAVGQTDVELEKYFVDNGIISSEALRIYSEVSNSPSQAAALYKFAVAQPVSGNFVVKQGTSVYAVKLGYELPLANKKVEESQPSGVSLKDSSSVAKVKDMFVGTAHANTPVSPTINLRIKILITDLNRGSYPSLSRYYSVAQLMQLYWPGQVAGRNIQVSEVSYYETFPGTPINNYCGPSGAFACSTSTALATAAKDPGLNTPNTHTLLIVPIIGTRDNCGLAYVPGNLAVVFDQPIIPTTATSGCTPIRPGADANVVAQIAAHEMMHSTGFPHEGGNTTLMASPCSAYTLFSCPVSAAQRAVLNNGSTYNSTFRVKSIPAYNCPVYFGVVYATVQQGSTGDCVRMLQWRMNNFNNGSKANVAINGVFDATTANAVRYLQGAARLPVTGVVDAATWSMINALST